MPALVPRAPVADSQPQCAPLPRVGFSYQTMNATTPLVWAKCPSVNRTGKYFFTAVCNGVRYWVKRPDARGWIAEDDCGGSFGYFPTANLAKLAVEAL